MDGMASVKGENCAIAHWVVADKSPCLAVWCWSGVTVEGRPTHKVITVGYLYIIIILINPWARREPSWEELFGIFHLPAPSTP
jgi:hypothetical protein